ARIVLDDDRHRREARACGAVTDVEGEAVHSDEATGGRVDDGRVAVVAAERAVRWPVDDVERVRPGTIAIRICQRDLLRERVVGPGALIGNDGSRVPSDTVGMPSFDGDGVERPARER